MHIFCSSHTFRKVKTYLPPRFMTVSQAAQQILESAKQLQVEDGSLSFSIGFHEFLTKD